jgi:AmmeMemoRadiSam system protein B
MLGVMLARLRSSLDFMPSPVPERPGLLMRDPFQFSDATLIIPPALVGCLEFFDGNHGELDLRAYLVKLTGDLDVGGLVQHLTETLSAAGFLEDETFARLKDAAERAFAEAPVREPAHAGSGYPDDKEQLSKTFSEYMNGAASRTGSRRPVAIAAPHVSPFGGVEAYRAAYSTLSPEDAERTFVILGTSHYGAPDRLGITRKPFVTPFGQTVTDTAIVDRIAQEAGAGALLEDYCHAVEHSIEFQVVFLQHLFGPRIRIVPILCGSFARSIYQGGLPEDDDNVRRALGALGELAAKEGERLLWVLGVDMAHMGRRYGDSFEAKAGRGEMEEVERRDRARIERMEQADAAGFWSLVQENRDDLKWCGSSPIYAFLKAVPEARARLLQYQQWNIDEQSVVSFAGARFD